MGSISLVIDISDGDLADEREEVRAVYSVSYYCERRLQRETRSMFFLINGPRSPRLTA